MAAHHHPLTSTLAPQPAQEELAFTVHPARAWGVVAILLVFVVLSYLDRMIISLMVDPIRSSLKISDSQMGLLQGPVFAAFFVFGSLPMGWLVDRYSRRWIIYFGVTAWSLATMACGLSQTFGQLLLARSLVGVGEATLQPAGWAVIGRLFPPTRLAFAISVFAAGSQVGSALSSLIGGLIIAGLDGATTVTAPIFGPLERWQLVFLVIGAPGLVLAFLIFLASEISSKPAPLRRLTPERGLARFLADNRLFLICHFAGFGLLAAAAYGGAAWLPTLLLRTYEVEIRTLGALLAVLTFVFGGGGMVLAGWIVDRWSVKGRRDAHMLYFALAALTIALVGAGFWQPTSLIVALACSALIHFLQPFSGVAAAVLQLATPEPIRGRVSSLYILTYNLIGMTLGPTLVAVLSDHFGGGTGLGRALALSYLICGCGAALLLGLGRRAAVRAVERQATAPA